MALLETNVHSEAQQEQKAGAAQGATGHAGAYGSGHAGAYGSGHAVAPGELDLFSFVLLLRAHLWRIVLFALAGFVIAAIYTYTRKPRYVAATSVVIPHTSAASIGLQSIGGLDLLGGGFEIYIDIMKSRTVQEDLIRDLHLLDKWKIKDIRGAEGLLAARSTFGAAPEGLLTITVQDEDPKLAAAIANQYLIELKDLNNRLTLTSATQQRKFYEQQMLAEKNALEDAEEALERVQEKTGTVEANAQVAANLGATEGLRAQLRAKQIELDSDLQGETDQNPNVIRLRAEIAGLSGQIQAEQSGGGGLAEGLTSAEAPSRTLTLGRATRDVRFHESEFESLQRQVELAKSQEAKDFSQVEVLDLADVPNHKSWPPRTQYSILGFLLGGVLGVVLTLLEALTRTVMKNPANQDRYRTLVAGRRTV